MTQNLEELNIENKNLLIQNQKLSNIVYDTRIFHYEQPDIESAIKLNNELKDINKDLWLKVEDIYDI